MDNIIQVKKLHNAKISGERRLLHDLLNNCSGKSETTRVTVRPPPPVFFSEAAPNIILESSCFKILQNSVEDTRCGFLF